mgnify:CR=1 FL=1
MDEFKRFNVKIDPLLGLLKLRKNIHAGPDSCD